MESIEKLNVFRRSYDFSKWLLAHTNHFPKSHRFSIAVKLENGILEFIEIITKANMRHKKMQLLIAADEKLMFLKIMIRMSYEMRFINIKSYEYGSRELVELGRMLGAWIKQQKNVS